MGVAMSSPESLTHLPLLSDFAAQVPFSKNVPDTLRMLTIIMMCIFLATAAKNCLLAYITWQQNYFSQGIAWSIGQKLFQRFLCAPYLWHTHQNSAELLTILNWKAYIATFSVAILTLVTQAIIAFFLFSGAIIANPLMSGFLFITVASFAVIIQKYSKKKIYTLSNALKGYDLYNSHVNMQGLHAIREIIIYDKKTEFLEKYKKYIEPYSATCSYQALFPNFPQWSLETIGIGLLLVVLLILITNNSSVANATGLITLLAAVSWRLLPATNKVIGALMTMRSQQPVIEKILTALTTPQSATPECRKILQFNDAIMLQDITFSYPSASKPALDHVSLNIPKGKMVGFIGLSGSGKSTLSAIITGLMTPDSGQLIVDGRPWDSTAKRLKIGYVPQNLYLLDASLAENVAFSQWGKTIDEARVKKCCQMAAIDFLADLPEDIHTVLGERGVRLSGGQVQRVGIARALYDNPDLLLFDEATSALDGAAENEIQTTISSLRSSITLLIIAHRLSTVAECDIVYWIDKGRIIRSGAPGEVLPEYEATLHQSAFSR